MLNVKCSKCNEGNLHLPHGYDGLADYYEIHCTKCSHILTTHYTGMDSILGEHDYNSQVNEDVEMLNANGGWMTKKQSIKINQFDKYTEGMELVQKIDADFTLCYYRNGMDFYMIEIACHGYSFDYCKYQAKSDEAVENLLSHFFKIGA